VEVNPKVVVITKDGNRLHGRAAWAERYLRAHPGATIETEKAPAAPVAEKPARASKAPKATETETKDSL